MADAPVFLEIVLVTPHGAPVPGATMVLVGGGATCFGVEREAGVYEATLPTVADYLLTIERTGQAGGFHHRTLRTVLFLTRPPGERASLRALDAPAGERSRVVSIEEEGSSFHLRVELDYLWFTPIGYPPTLGNAVEVFSDGEEGWRAVALAMETATRWVHVTTWIYQPTTELLRTEPLADPPVRAPFTVQSFLHGLAAKGVLVRLLLWDAPFLPMQGDARAAARAAGDDFEVMQESNPTRRPLLREDEWGLYARFLGDFEIGSHHQKTVVVDGEMGFVMGMNLKENDWDTTLHAPFEPRRCRFSRPASFRRRVLDREEQPDHPPRHDFTARVRGPAVAHLEANFRERWNRLIAAGAGYAENATRVEPPAEGAARGATQVQVVRTMPAPEPERGILDLYLRAIRAARRLVYIEDQYFRSTYVSDALADAVRTWPGLHLVVVTTEAQTAVPFAGSWSRECYDRVRRRRKDFELYTLRVAQTSASGKLVLDDVDNHAKLMIVDDQLVTLGSCNLNDRGFEFEGELNVAFVDATLAKDLRVRLWRAHLGDDARLTGDLDGDVAIWKERAERNRHYTTESGVAPASHVFPFAPRASRVVLFGHDVF